MITLITRYVEGNRKVVTYKTLEGARKAAAKRFGKSPERGGGYIHDDYAVLYVEGCTFDDLFPESEEAKERAKLPSAARPYEVWYWHVDEMGCSHRKVRAGAFATLWEAEQEGDELDQCADGVHLVGVTDEAKAELDKRAAALRAQFFMDDEIERAKLADADADDMIPF